jgi:adenylate cyclase
MFTDLVGYSALAHRDEKLAIELLDLHRGWIREILPNHGGIEIETVGDAFLIEFAGALSAIECAVAIQSRFADHNKAAPAERRMQLRIGIHLGDVEHRDGKVMGDGVNIASRIHGIAEPGGICVSEQVYSAVRNRAGLAFTSLGAPRLKNIATSVELFRVGAAGTQTSRLFVRGTTFRRRYAWPLVVTAALAALVLGLWRVSGQESGPPSIAVLPFANLSDNAQASEYFVDGMHDAIITHLAKVKDVKVISRTSVMEYKGAARNLRDIGRLLGVENVVEGSVQRVGGRIRVTAQLIKVSNDAHLWAESYDRDTADVFAIQSDIASAIATQAHAALAPAEARRIQAHPTASADAYDLYLRGTAFKRGYAFDSAGLRSSEDLLKQAIALDPGFAAAHASLAENYLYRYWAGWEARPEHRERARREAEAALAADPELAEAHVAMAQYHYRVNFDYDPALKELETAVRLQPSAPEAYQILGAVLRRQAKWEPATAALKKASELDPRNGQLLWDVGLTLEATHRFAEADAYYARSIALAPDVLRFKLERATLAFHWRGDLAPLRKLLAGIPAEVDPDGWVSMNRYWLAMYEGHYEEAARHTLNPFNVPGSEAMSLGFALKELEGRTRETGKAFRQALRQMQTALDNGGPKAIPKRPSIRPSWASSWLQMVAATKPCMPPSWRSS